MTTNEEYLERQLAIANREIAELKEILKDPLSKIKEKDDHLFMAASVLSARDNEVAELTGALEEANQTISSLKSELNFKAA